MPDEEPRNVPILGQVEAVSGRRTSGGERGIPMLATVSFSTPSGAIIDARLPRGDEVEAEARIIAAADARQFDVCPICLSADPSTREHVPPAALGGSAVINTCAPCNNELGSKIDQPLVDWFEHALGRIGLSAEGVSGRRSANRLLLRQTDFGEFVLILEGGADPEVPRILSSGSGFNLTYALPDPDRVRLALLKSAYLGACLLLRQIPESSRAREIRAELLAAREAPRSSPLALSDATRTLRFARTYLPAGQPTVGLAVIAGNEGTLEFSISLANVLGVGWPLEPLTVIDESTSSAPPSPAETPDVGSPSSTTQG